MFLVDSGSTTSLYGATESTYVSGVIDFTLPVRSTNKSIIVDRFSAPGGPEVNSRGYLDRESETYSVYNALPWRNLTVRTSLDTLYKKHCDQFGIDSEYGSPSASYHKVNRNTGLRIENSGTSQIAYLTATKADNWFVQHAIPRMDMQYAWVTASYSSYKLSGSRALINR